MEQIKVLHHYKSFNRYNGLIEILTIMAQNFNHALYEFGICVFEYQENSFGKKFEEYGGKIFNLGVKKTPISEINSFIKLYKFLLSYKPHIFQTHVLKSNLYGILAAKLASVPVVIATEMTLKDTAFTPLRRARDKMLHPLLSPFLNNADLFVVTSQFIKNEWRKQCKEEKFNVIYPPFSLEKYEKALHVNQIETIKENKFRIGYIGRLSEEKGVRFLINSIPALKKVIPNVKVIIAGTGPLEDELKKLAKRKGIEDSVSFTGQVANAFEVLKDLDLFVLPSRSEGCPIVVLEAMAMGLPVVATNAGGTPELLVDGETGLLISYGDTQALVDSISKILTNQNIALDMGIKGKDRAFSKFHPSFFTSHFEQLYKNLYDKKVSILKSA